MNDLSCATCGTELSGRTKWAVWPKKPKKPERAICCLCGEQGMDLRPDGTVTNRNRYDGRGSIFGEGGKPIRMVWRGRGDTSASAALKGYHNRRGASRG